MAKTPISKIMSKKVIAVRPDTPVEQVAELMLQYDLSRLPVIDPEGRPVGIISKTDLVYDAHERQDTEQVTDGARIPSKRGISYELRGMHLEELAGRIVEDVMHKRAVVLPPTATVAHAAKVMSQDHLHGIPVVSGSGQLIGMLSAMDLISWMAAQ